MMKSAVVTLCMAGILMLTGCAMYENAIRQQKVVDKQTVFVRDSSGAVKGIEIKRTEGNYYIGPDGKVFANNPSSDQLKKLYCK